MNEETKGIKAIETRGSLENPNNWVIDTFGADTSSGIGVNTSNAMNFVAVYAAVRVLAETIASLPLVTYRRTARGKSRAINHPAYELLHDSPNSETTALNFREALMAHVLTHGNGYAEIVRDGAGLPRELWLIPPDRVDVGRDKKGRVVYEIEGGQRGSSLSSSSVLHVAGMGYDGLVGYSPIAKLRESIGLGLAAEKFGGAFFANGSRPSGVLRTPGRLNDDSLENLRRTWQHAYSGAANSGSVPILEQGLEWQSIGIPPDDAQFLETRKFQVREIAAAFRVPPHMLADLESGASYASIEQMSLEFTMYSLRPWLVRIEQELSRKLFKISGDKDHYAEHLVDGLLRGDTSSRYAAYKSGRDTGFLSINDIRRLENMDAIEAPEADAYLQPLNMAAILPGGGIIAPVSADEVEQEPEAELAPTRSEPCLKDIVADREGIASSFRELFRDGFGRLLKVESNAARRASKKGAEEIRSWVEAGTAAEKAAEILGPAVRAVVVQSAKLVAKETGADIGFLNDDFSFSTPYLDGLTRRHVERNKVELSESKDIDSTLAMWREARPDEEAETELRRLIEGATLATYQAVGVKMVTWKGGDLEGRSFAPGETAARAGEIIAGHTVERNITHPPLKDGDISHLIAATTKEKQ